MDLKSRLTALVEAAPPDATVTVRWLAELLATAVAPEAGQLNGGDVRAVDLTVEQVAAHFGKGTSTVRTWLGRGELEGAYRLHGREWRIPAAAVVALQRSQARQHAQQSTGAPKSRHAPDLSEWRRHTTGTSQPVARK